MINTCKICKYWTRNKNTEYYTCDLRFGKCKCDKFVYEDDDRNPHSADSLLYWDYEGWNAYFVVGEDFGCVHYSEKENAKPEP